MCIEPEPMIKEEIKTVTIKPARKIRTKIRKPKFLSLCLELSPENTQSSGEISTTSSDHQHHQQLNLFPLHPENLVEEKDSAHEDNMACFFSAGDGAATTLTGLLEENHQSPSSVEYGYSGGGRMEEEGDQLVRTAMRNKERDASEEKWVCYSEVVEMIKEEEVNSSGGGGDELWWCNYSKDQWQRLSLKLDYQKIMNVWSDKGPLYIHLDSPQTVPDILDDDFPSSAIANELRQGWESSNGGVWRVPEMTSVKEEAIGWEEGMNMNLNMKGQREASVQRYKEKRQNRLFAKTIRYQVRKLNAEKRPRLKGRFVKRC